MSSTLIDLPQLVDLALGTPESGAVNFNVLHALLHAVVQLLNADDVRVELIGTPICKPEASISDIGPRQMTVEEFKLEYKGKESKKVLIEKPPVNVGKLLVVRKSSKDGEVIPTEPIQKSSTQRMAAGKSTTPHASTAEISQSVAEGDDKPQNMGVVSLEDSVIFAKRFDDVDKKILKFEKSLQNLKETCDKKSDIANITERVEFLEKELRNKEPGERTLSESQEKFDTKRTNYFDENQLSAIQEELRNVKNEVGQLKLTIQRSTKYVEDDKAQTTNKGSIAPSTPSTVEKEDEDICSDLAKTVDHKVELLNSKLLTMNDRILDIEKQVFEIVERFEESIEAKDSGAAQISITDLYNDIMEIKSLVADTSSHCNFLLSERNSIRAEVNNLVKSVDEIKDTKVDKDDIDELLSEKADYNMLQRKVSVDYFDASKRDLENIILETMTKMQEREVEWCKSIEDMKRQLESKLNSSEITAVKEYLERRLQSIIDQMNVLCAAKKDPEAAGTKTKMLKNLNCISCNQDVLMRTEEISKVPKAESLPAHKSIKPFLTYELDNLRKHIKQIPNSRNMHHFETLLKDKGLIMDKKARQICTRYCGGSHTIITPQARVERGRCGKMFGAKATTAKCICAEPPIPPCTCPDDQEEPVYTCPDEPEICPCPSEQDPFEKCLSAPEKRCIEIDRNRREQCKEEMEVRRQKCRDETERHEKCLEETARREKCKIEVERRDKCLPEKQMRDRCAIEAERRERCKLELEKYAKCKELGNQDQRKHLGERVNARGQSPCVDSKESCSRKRESGENYSYIRYSNAENTETERSVDSFSRVDPKIKQKHITKSVSSIGNQKNTTTEILSEGNRVLEKDNEIPLETQIDVERKENREPELIPSEPEESINKVAEMEETEEFIEQSIMEEDAVQGVSV